MSRFNEELEEHIMGLCPDAAVRWLMELGLLPRESHCRCGEQMKLVKYTRNIDECAWRCYNSQCLQYIKYISVRAGTWFGRFALPLKAIMKVVHRYSVRHPRYCIVESVSMTKKSVIKILSALIELMPSPDFSDNKMGGPGMIVQIDETMLNHSCKNNRGKPPSNHTDALVIVECGLRVNR
ncbi:hypothetical protein ENBRE01_2682, partial [Enteropsectra breve]